MNYETDLNVISSLKSASSNEMRVEVKRKYMSLKLNFSI